MKYSERYVKCLRGRIKNLRKVADKKFRGLYALHDEVRHSDGALHASSVQPSGFFIGNEERANVSLTAEQLREMVLEKIVEIMEIKS
jgi:hypothetical protein